MPRPPLHRRPTAVAAPRPPLRHLRVRRLQVRQVDLGERQVPAVDRLEDRHPPTWTKHPMEPGGRRQKWPGYLTVGQWEELAAAGLEVASPWRPSATQRLIYEMDRHLDAGGDPNPPTGLFWPTSDESSTIYESWPPSLAACSSSSARWLALATTTSRSTRPNRPRCVAIRRRRCAKRRARQPTLRTASFRHRGQPTRLCRSGSLTTIRKRARRSGGVGDVASLAAEEIGLVM